MNSMTMNAVTDWISSNPKTAYGAAACACYMLLVRYCRYKNLKWIRENFPDPNEVLHDSKKAAALVAMTGRKEFPFFFRQFTELALFKTYQIPSISKLLVATGEFEKYCDKRAEDTELLLAEIHETHARIENERARNPKIDPKDIEFNHKRPTAAITRLNELHGKYNIKNGDYVYTLSLFIVEPVTWTNAYEWRPLEPVEINANFKVWYDMGVAMNLKDIPETYEAMYKFKEEYERDHARYASSNWICAKSTLVHLLQGVPRFFHPLVFKLLPVVLTDGNCVAFGLKPPSTFARKVLGALLLIRAFVVRHFYLPRRNYFVRTPFLPNAEGRFVPVCDIYKPIYPNGYRIGELGPDKFMPKCPVQM